MRNLIASINVTADGFCNHYDGIADEEHHDFAASLLADSDLLLLGRVTYQLFEGFWPKAATDDTIPKYMKNFGQVITKIPKVVASRSAQSFNWEHTTGIHDLEGSVTALKQQHGKDILIFGSPGLVAELTRAGLIDEYYLSVQPMLAGHGKRLFDKINLHQSNPLRLEDSFVFKSGVMTLLYKR